MSNIVAQRGNSFAQKQVVVPARGQKVVPAQKLKAAPAPKQGFVLDVKQDVPSASKRTWRLFGNRTLL